MIRLKVGSKAPAGSQISLCRGILDERQVYETFPADENRDWVCPETVNGFWYGYETVGFGVIAEKDTGRKVTRTGVEYRIRHLLIRTRAGWSVHKDVCDVAADEIVHCKSETEARKLFDSLEGELI